MLATANTAMVVAKVPKSAPLSQPTAEAIALMPEDMKVSVIL